MAKSYKYIVNKKSKVNGVDEASLVASSASDSYRSSQEETVRVKNGRSVYSVK